LRGSLHVVLELLDVLVGSSKALLQLLELLLLALADGVILLGLLPLLESIAIE
jgi:membrane-associated HD superfamily phosphohydrolase